MKTTISKKDATAIEEIVDRLNKSATELQDADEGTRYIDTTANLKNQVNKTISLIKSSCSYFNNLISK